MNCISQQENSVLASKIQAPSILRSCHSPHDPEWLLWLQPPHPHSSQQEETPPTWRTFPGSGASSYLASIWSPGLTELQRSLEVWPLFQEASSQDTSRVQWGRPAGISAAGAVGEAVPHPAELGSESLGLKDEAGGLSCPRMVFPWRGGGGGGSQEGLGSK